MPTVIAVGFEDKIAANAFRGEAANVIFAVDRSESFRAKAALGAGDRGERPGGVRRPALGQQKNDKPKAKGRKTPDPVTDTAVKTPVFHIFFLSIHTSALAFRLAYGIKLAAVNLPVFSPQRTVPYPDALLIINHCPVDGRNCAMSALPSPS